MLGNKIVPDGGKQNYSGFLVTNVFANTQGSEHLWKLFWCLFALFQCWK